MTIPADPTPALQEYAHPEKLVTTQWLAEQLEAGRPADLVVVESDEDVLLYETGHIPGAVKIDWHLDLNDPVTRDYVDGEGFAKLMSSKGISREDTLVVYGDKSNWWAAYAMWVFSLFGHEDVRLMDGGRQKWEAEGREYTREKPARPATEYPVVSRDDEQIRAFLPEVRDAIGSIPLIDVRSAEEYSGERTHMPAYPEEGALRGGHIPTAKSVPWAKAANEDGTFKSADQLKALYLDDLGLEAGGDIIAYCRIGERSSHTWFALHELLGDPNVKNYDGSWTEYGSLVGVPIEKDV